MTETDLIRRFAEALSKGTGSLFVGAGVSAGSGLPDWEQALSELTKERLSIEIDRSDSFPLLAQYIVNKDMGNRGSLISSLKSIFHRLSRQNPNHHAISLMNVKTIWTTNYDTLLEEAFAGSHIAVRVNDDGITWPIPAADIEIIKMHGCIDRSRQDDIVITQEDYEDYHIRRPATVQRLRQDIITKSLLFVGYSFRDPNVASLFTIARRLKSSATQTHYMIAKRGRRADLRAASWYEDLRRAGIHVVEVDDYSQIPRILLNIAKKSVGRTIYFTGSHKDANRDERTYCAEVGRRVAELYKSGSASISDAPVVMDGQSTGRSREIIAAFVNSIIDNRLDIRRHIRFYSNSYSSNPHLADNPSLIPLLKQMRAPLMKNTQVVVAFDGGMGTEAEVQLAREYKCRLLPVPRVRGGSASNLLKDSAIAEDLSSCCPSYLWKARRMTATAADVAGAVRSMLDSHTEVS
jgi:hypothetical protein